MKNTRIGMKQCKPIKPAELVGTAIVSKRFLRCCTSSELLPTRLDRPPPLCIPPKLGSGADMSIPAAALSVHGGGTRIKPDADAHILHRPPSPTFYDGKVVF